MKEFDFDELDKAVNSLMGDVKTPEPAPVSVPTPTLALAAEPAPVSTPPQPMPVPSVSPTPPALPVKDTTPSSAPTPTPPPAALTPPRPSGRFMDVVHPSADMKAAPVVASPAPSREGVTIQPPARSTEVATAPSRPVIDIMAAPNAQPKPVSATPSLAAPAPEPTPEPVASAPIEPWVSPFLPDAQVEKRPLGAAPATPTVDLSESIAAELAKSSPMATPKETETKPESETEAPKQETTTSPETKEPAESEKPSAPDKKVIDDEQLSPEATRLPAELASDLMAIESGHAGLQDEIEPVRKGAESRASSSPSVGSLAARAVATGSIPQQYSEQPSTGDESHTPIYDNEAEHQPLKHPAKKKSGWMWVIFIVIILLIGAALGGAAYYFGLI